MSGINILIRVLVSFFQKDDCLLYSQAELTFFLKKGRIWLLNLEV